MARVGVKGLTTHGEKVTQLGGARSITGGSFGLLLLLVLW